MVRDLRPRGASAESLDAVVDLTDDRAERHDVQHALALLHEVDQRVAVAGEDRAAFGEDDARGLPVGALVLAQVLDRLAGVLELDAGVE